MSILKRKVEERKVSNIYELCDVIQEGWKRIPVAICEALVNSRGLRQCWKIMVAPLKMYTFGPIVMVKPNNLHTGGRLTHVGTMVFQLVLLKTHFIFFYHVFLQPPLRTSGAWLAWSCCPPPSYCPRSSP